MAAERPPTKSVTSIYLVVISGGISARVGASWLVLLIADVLTPYSQLFSEISGLRIARAPWGESFSAVKGAAPSQGRPHSKGSPK
jgi:hypothetical protein